MEVCSTEEALGLLNDNSEHGVIFDVIVLDMRMPKTDGLELAQAIRQAPGCGFVPLVMLSPLADVGTAKERREAGLDAWLSKPVRQANLHDTLATVIGNGAIQPRSVDTRQKPVDMARECDALRILVAEDNRVNQAVLEGMLHVLGHTTWVAGTGCEALAAFQSQEFDVVLMDCLMPVMDGFEATCNIRKWEEQNNRAPTTIVAVTANVRKEDREHCLALGMDDFLSKPFSFKQLTQVLEQKTSTQAAPTGLIEAQNSEMSISEPHIDQASKTAADVTVLQSMAQELKSNIG